jgi:hypothetical protein
LIVLGVESAGTVNHTNVRVWGWFVGGDCARECVQRDVRNSGMYRQQVAKSVGDRLCQSQDNMPRCASFLSKLFRAAEICKFMSASSCQVNNATQWLHACEIYCMLANLT